MSRKVRPHGTHAKYVVERCHCAACRAANAAYGHRRARENAERAWGTRPPVFVDAGPTRRYLFVLRKAGLGPLQIALLSGLGKTAQWKITSRRVLRVRPETQDAVLGVATDDHVFLGSYVDAAPAKAILAELLSAGMTKTALARALGARAKTPALQVARRERCTLGTLRRLEKLREIVERAS